MPCTIVILARSIDNLEKLKSELSGNGVLIHAIQMDLENSESISQAVSEMNQLIPQIDWLFNNGGVSQRGLAQSTDFKVVRKIMEVNFMGTIEFTLACSSLLKKSPKPGIVVTSSIVGLFGYPRRSAYSASKHALQGYFESMQLESDSPSVTIVSPGSIKTDIAQKALDEQGKANGKAEDRLDKGMSPDVLAKKILAAAAKRKKKAYLGKAELLMVYFHKYLPFLFKFIAKRRSDN